MVEAPHVSLLQAVAVAEAGPAIAPLHKFVAETEPELRVSDQIGDLVDLHFLRQRLFDADSVGIVETQRRTYAQVPLRQCALDLVPSGDALTGENFLGDGAGVFGVDIDIAIEQRGP